MTARKFFKTTFIVEVLSEDRPLSEGLSLQEIAYNITDGDCSGSVNRKSILPLNGKEAADALRQQGSDTEFFAIDAEGNDVG